MLRNAAAIILGIVTAFVTVMLIDMLGHMIYPPPEGLDFSDASAVEPYLATLPIGAFLFIFASSVVATFIGTLVAIFVGTIRPRNCAGIIGTILLAASIANFIAIPHPLWLSALTVVGIIASAWLATKLAPRASSTAAPEQDEI